MTPLPAKTAKPFLAVLFFFSGFCGLLYQLVWMRLAFASFGVNTPVMSVVLSVFMAGLAFGSWGGGRLTSRWSRSSRLMPLYFYAGTETLIGLGAFAVPLFFSIGQTFLLTKGDADSTQYLFLSAIVLFLSIFPWCLLMGTTFPFMMAFIRNSFPAKDSFSFLYTANVLGAMTGVFATAVVLIEKLGFHGTLAVAACFNIGIGLASAAAGAVFGKRFPKSKPLSRSSSMIPSPQKSSSILAILFVTGFVAMSMEVIWTRDFTIILKTQVYSYASLLFTYLLSTFIGSSLYRRLQLHKTPSNPQLLMGVFVFALLTVILNDPRIQLSVHGVLLSIVPFCLALGFLTPKLVDHFSDGDPAKAAYAYAVNTLGCIFGPLAASYLLLPYLGVKVSLVLLSLLFVPFFLKHLFTDWRWNPWRASVFGFGLVLLTFCVYSSFDYERFCGAQYPSYILYRDYAATVIAGGEGLKKRIYVNGIIMTGLCETTKSMAHLPLSFCPHQPKTGLVICFGMGTTFRSMISWGIQTTVVELVPSVFRCFNYFYHDTDRVLSSPLAHPIVDDGRRFLKRTSQTFDVITVDPPPPMEAAGSSLLYSVQFYDLVKRHLNPGGILQQWIPVGNRLIWQAMARSLAESFPYVRVFPSNERLGCHFLASMTPIPSLTPQQLAQKLPASALRDLREWDPTLSPEAYYKSFLSQEIPISALIDPNSQNKITDDRPYNEYYLLRNLNL